MIIGYVDVVWLVWLSGFVFRAGRVYGDMRSALRVAGKVYG